MTKNKYTPRVDKSQHVGLFDITLGVDTVLDESFPQIPIHSGEAQEGMTLPAFYVDVVPTAFRHQSEYYKEMVVQVSVKYLTSSKKRLELIHMSDEIARAFDVVMPVKDRYLQLFDISSHIDEEGTFSFDFELRFVTFMDREETAEIMRYLEITQ